MGINMMLHWPGTVLSALQPHLVVLRDSDDQQKVEHLLGLSAALQQQLRSHAGQKARVGNMVVSCLGNNMARCLAAHQIDLFGHPTIGMIVTEDTHIDTDRREAAREYPLLIAGSRWGAAVLEAAGLTGVRIVLQGVDTELFRPQPRAGWHKDRFKVFSGGKLEYRKGQDLVLLAFRAFAARHPDALLVVAWFTGWPGIEKSFIANPRVGAPPLTPSSTIDIPAWAGEIGIPRNQILDLGAVPNSEMPKFLCEMDAAVFPNRCEGGTNLVAMECLATGVPVILSSNTGHIDMIERVECYPLVRQTPVTAAVPGMRGTEGWSESDVDEIVEHLEHIYARRDAARERGLRAAEAMRPLTWRRWVQEVHDAVAEFL